MSTITPELSRTCRRCSSDLPAAALVCSRCRGLVRSGQLDRLASEGEALERKHDYRQARERWLMGLPLLPSNSRLAA